MKLPTAPALCGAPAHTSPVPCAPQGPLQERLHDVKLHVRREAAAALLAVWRAGCEAVGEGEGAALTAARSLSCTTHAGDQKPKCVTALRVRTACNELP
jgi:hypothetical protein